MQVLLTSLIILCLAVITYQDFKERKISWLSLPVLLALFISNALLQLASWKDYFFEVGINLVFVCLQLSILFIYFSIKEKKLTSLVNTKIGIGDILFFVVLSFAFSTTNFVLFYVGSLSIITIVFLLLKIFIKNLKTEIPLAGAMAVLLAAWYLIYLLYPSMNPLLTLILDI